MLLLCGTVAALGWSLPQKVSAEDKALSGLEIGESAHHGDATYQSERDANVIRNICEDIFNDGGPPTVADFCEALCDEARRQGTGYLGCTSICVAGLLVDGVTNADIVNVIEDVLRCEELN